MTSLAPRRSGHFAQIVGDIVAYAQTMRAAIAGC
jgi:hypothetical protein